MNAKSERKKWPIECKNWTIERKKIERLNAWTENFWKMNDWTIERKSSERPQAW